MHCVSITFFIQLVLVIMCCERTTPVVLLVSCYNAVGKYTTSVIQSVLVKLHFVSTVPVTQHVFVIMRCVGTTLIIKMIFVIIH